MAEARNQFTFYRSYYDAIQDLPKRDQSTIILAICAYALYEQEPPKLSPAASTAFNLIRPTLDSARKKAANGKQGGSKTKAPPKQTVRENEKEKEKEIEIESDSSKTEAAKVFEQLFNQYPAWRRGNRQAAWEAFQNQELSLDNLQKVISNLSKWKISEQWTKNGGQYVPNLRNWLECGIWKVEPPKTDTIPCGAVGELGDAEMEAIQQLLSRDIPDAELPEDTHAD